MTINFDRKLRVCIFHFNIFMGSKEMSYEGTWADPLSTISHDSLSNLTQGERFSKRMVSSSSIIVSYILSSSSLLLFELSKPGNLFQTYCVT